MTLQMQETYYRHIASLHANNATVSRLYRINCVESVHSSLTRGKVLNDGDVDEKVKQINSISVATIVATTTPQRVGDTTHGGIIYFCICQNNSQTRILSTS